MSIGSRTGCLLAGHYLSKRVVYRLSRTKVRLQVSIDHDDLARPSLDVMTTPGTTPKSLVIDLRHLLQRLRGGIVLSLHSVVVHEGLRRVR